MLPDESPAPSAAADGTEVGLEAAADWDRWPAADVCWAGMSDDAVITCGRNADCPAGYV